MILVAVQGRETSVITLTFSAHLGCRVARRSGRFGTVSRMCSHYHQRTLQLLHCRQLRNMFRASPGPPCAALLVETNLAHQHRCHRDSASSRLVIPQILIQSCITAGDNAASARSPCSVPPGDGARISDSQPGKPNIPLPEAPILRVFDPTSATRTTFFWKDAARRNTVCRSPECP